MCALTARAHTDPGTVARPRQMAMPELDRTQLLHTQNGVCASKGGASNGLQEQRREESEPECEHVHVVGSTNKDQGLDQRSVSELVCVVGANKHSDLCLKFGNLAHRVPKDDVEEVTCDRSSVLGNPFLMGRSGKDDSKRDAVCIAHAQLLNDIVAGASVVDVREVAAMHGVEVAKNHQCLNCDGVRSELNMLTQECWQVST